MIDLTPLEVRQKKGDFHRSFRGYDAELVNDFLDLVADRMEELVKQNMDLQDAVGDLREELGEYRKKEQSLSDALMTAQQLRDDARSHAEKEGELLVREARLAAESARQEASKSLAREEETLRQVRARRGQLVESFRRMLERELNELEVIEETLELEADKAEARTAAGAAEPPAAEPEPEAEREAEPESEHEAVHEAEHEDLFETDTLAGPEPEPAAPEIERASPEMEAPSPEIGGGDDLLDIESFETEERPRAAPRRSPEPPAAPGGEPKRAQKGGKVGRQEAPADDDEDLQEDWLKSLVEE